MYKNTGGTLRTLSTIICIGGCVLFIVYGFLLWNLSPVIALTVMFVGSFGSYLLGLFLHAFGDIICYLKALTENKNISGTKADPSAPAIQVSHEQADIEITFITDPEQLAQRFDDFDASESVLAMSVRNISNVPFSPKDIQVSFLNENNVRLNKVYIPEHEIIQLLNEDTFFEKDNDPWLLLLEKTPGVKSIQYTLQGIDLNDHDLTFSGHFKLPR